MKRLLVTGGALVAAAPAMAAPEGVPFFSLYNTDIVVAIAFVLFVGILVYYRVPGTIGRLLDERSAAVRADLEEARQLREEAQQVLASFERKQREVEEQAERIVEAAKRDAEETAAQAQRDMEAQVERRLKAAEDQISSAESAALRSVRDRAARIAIAVAADVVAKQMTPDQAGRLVDEGIAKVEARLH